MNAVLRQSPLYLTSCSSCDTSDEYVQFQHGRTVEHVGDICTLLVQVPLLAVAVRSVHSSTGAKMLLLVYYKF